MKTIVRAPAWLRVVAVLLILWGLFGVIACVQQARFGADAIGAPTEYDRRLFAQLPGWYLPLYGVATGSGLLGALALFARSRLAVPLFAISTLAVVIQFGWTFLATDLIAAKGVGATVPFPVFIAGVAAGATWLSARAARRGWIG